MFLASCQFGFFEFYGNLPDLSHIKLHFKLEGVASCPLMSFCTYKRHILKTNKNQFIIRNQRDWMCFFFFFFFFKFFFFFFFLFFFFFFIFFVVVVGFLFFFLFFFFLLLFIIFFIF